MTYFPYIYRRSRAFYKVSLKNLPFGSGGVNSFLNNLKKLLLFLVLLTYQVEVLVLLLWLVLLALLAYLHYFLTSVKDRIFSVNHSIFSVNKQHHGVKRC